MTTDYLTAQDAIFGRFNAEWAANTTAIVGYVPQVYWHGKVEVTKPPGDRHFVRVSVQTVSERQATLAYAGGTKRYRTDGLVLVQLFAPINSAPAWRQCQRLAVLAKNAYRGQTASGNIWFRNVRINELLPEVAYHRINVVAEYEFDEIA